MSCLVIFDVNFKKIKIHSAIKNKKKAIVEDIKWDGEIFLKVTM